MKTSKRKVITVIAMAVLAVAICNCIFIAESYRKALVKNNKEPYFYINEYPVTRLEYDFYFNKYKNDYIKEFSDLFDYMGVDPDTDLLGQKYDENRTFGEYLDKCTKDSMCRVYALKEDGLKNGFVYDTDNEYRRMLKSLNNEAKDDSMSLRRYLKNEYGFYADEVNLKPFFEDFFYAIKYNESLYATIDRNEDTDKAVFDYVEGLKEKYEVIQK